MEHTDAYHLEIFTAFVQLSVAAALGFSNSCSEADCCFVVLVFYRASGMFRPNWRKGVFAINQPVAGRR
jgi:hypothetical protein